MPLNHVSLTVADRERSAAFYGRHLGLTERVHEDEQRVILGSPDGSLLAVCEGAVPDALPPTNHFGFQVAREEEVHAARRRFRSAGVEEREWQDDHGFVRVQVADPDGYRVDIFAFAGKARPPRSRWTSFVAHSSEPRPRVLSEQNNSKHRARVEHNRDTLLVHVSDEDGSGWTVLAIDRATRRWAVAQARRQLEASEDAFTRLYPGA